MAALTADRKLVILKDNGEMSLPCGVDEFFVGGMVMTLDGYASMGTDGYGLSYTTGKVWGVCDRAVSCATSNTKRVSIHKGHILMNNDGSAAVARTHVGANCYLVDDNTVSSSANGGGTASRLVAGVVVEVRSDGVVVLFG